MMMTMMEILWKLTLKKALVDPEWYVPYLILVCLAKSSAELMGIFIWAAVKKAARFAVYDEIMMRVKNHQILATALVEIALIWRKNIISLDLKLNK